MKKILIIVAAFSLFSSSCHYGKEAAEDSLKRNDKYKETKNDRQSPTPGDDYIESQGTPTEAPVAEPTDTTVVK